jgi:hypothetical protein
LAAKPDPFRIALRGILAADRLSIAHRRVAPIMPGPGRSAKRQDCQQTPAGILKSRDENRSSPGAPAYLLITRNVLNQNVFE